MKNSTVNANRADGEGGGIYREDTGTADSPLLSSTIIANNLPDGLAEESGSEGSFRAEFTLIEFPGNATISDQTPGSNIFNADPSLGPLTNNGGPTATHLPAADSLAIDAGIANGLANDQRGFPRTVDLAKANANGSDGTDIGAVERQTVEPPPSGGGGGGGGTTPPPGTTPTGDTCQGAAATKQSGTAANDTLSGTGAVDLIEGSGGNDQVSGSGGNDCLKGQDGNDTVRGQGGNDKVKGNAGNDQLKGGGGADSLTGADGGDRVKGGGGQDRLKGNGGSDKLSAADGAKDRVNCGGGQDKATVDSKDKVSNNCENVTVK